MCVRSRLNPKDLEENRAKGKMDDRQELSFLQRTMAYGISCVVDPDAENQYIVT